MSMNLENRWPSLSKNEGGAMTGTLGSLTIKEIDFNNNQNQLNAFRPRNMKYAMPTKIYHHGYYKLQNKNKKMLPGLQFKTILAAKTPGQDPQPSIDKQREKEKEKDSVNQREKESSGVKNRNFGNSLRNTRNSEILNSIIQILKTDTTDSMDEFARARNARIKTQPSCSNQFIQMRDISSVKNSRGPKIINNQIMMAGNQKYKRNLVSQQKHRPKNFGLQQVSIGRVSKKLDPFDEMQMTFYKPSRVGVNDNASNWRKVEQNQFLCSTD